MVLCRLAVSGLGGGVVVRAAFGGRVVGVHGGVGASSDALCTGAEKVGLDWSWELLTFVSLLQWFEKEVEETYCCEPRWGCAGGELRGYLLVDGTGAACKGFGDELWWERGREDFEEGESGNAFSYDRVTAS